MASSTSNKTSLFFLLLIFISSFSSSAGTDDVRLSSSAYLPKIQAEKLIRELNLFPKEDINIPDYEPSVVGDKKIVEKHLTFPHELGVSGPSAEDLGHHAGYYQLPHSRAARMFYLFFESRNSKDDPIVIWLTGGPGCSSELALFYENGPFQITKNLSLVWNDYGWDKASNLLYVDQPIGTGFSYTSDESDIRHDEDGVSSDLYDFLQAFFKEHPQFAKNDFYITGESYAGHYIPAFAARVHQGNKAKEGIQINLKGFAIGGLIKKTDYDRITKLIPACEQGIKECGTDGGSACVSSYTVCSDIFNSIMGIAGNINYYDIRKKCEGDLCYDFSNMETFLNKKSVRDALGVGDIDFVSCSSEVYDALLRDWMRNLEVGIPALLEDGIRMLVYAGEDDLICNWLGNSRWVHAMEWSGKEQFGASATVPFIVDSAQAGLMKSHGPLTFLKVHDAGHMVPMDQPKAALQMLRSWMQGKLTITETEHKVSPK
ncbi:Carboxypeptidase [Quillaja saponaria]|uniref:Carboxypeptidase n=1 Tax=Quillaja saponaria TaxID=32244 RepID=A0AAD7KY07_QUISA|nr:Carboxypeptidase [Quillaja saponaria]